MSLELTEITQTRNDFISHKIGHSSVLIQENNVCWIYTLGGVDWKNIKTLQSVGNIEVKKFDVSNFIKFKKREGSVDFNHTKGASSV